MKNITLDRDADGRPVFVIGLTMAGAISAGAYTAGVVDYLMRAMQAHNARVGTKGGPRHKVVLKTISGASAGGICAGLIACNLFAVGAEYKKDGKVKSEPTWDKPETFSYTDIHFHQQHCAYVLRRIYQAWVTEVKMWDPASSTGLLALDDFEKDPQRFDQTIETALLKADGKDEEDIKKVTENINAGRAKAGPLSVLNGVHLDQVAKHALDGIPIWNSAHPGYDFIASDLDLFLTTTAISPNVYKIDFLGGPPFELEEHSIVRHFRMKGLGSGPALPSPWLEAWRDEGITLDPKAVPQDDTHKDLPLVREDGGDWAQLTVASIASGAFPLGLAPRIIAATPLELGKLPPTGNAKGGALPYDIPVDHVVRPDFGDTAIDAHTPYVAVDGGMANNEPFGYARYTIRQKGRKPGELSDNPRDTTEANRAVLMVDPFPEGAAFSVLKAEKMFKMLGLVQIAKKLVGVFTGQARFKPAELVYANDPKVHSRFLISPRRTVNGKTFTGKWAIACGLLGGFGGFFDQAFREHDFVLGQRNCQKFLNDTFTLDVRNRVLDLPDDENIAGTTKPVIDPGPMAHDEVRLPVWPGMSGKTLNDAVGQLKTRLDKLVAGEAKVLKKGWIYPLWKHFPTELSIPCRGPSTMAVDMTVGAILQDLILRDQIACFAAGEDCVLHSDAERVVLAALAGEGSSYVTAEELHASLSEDQEEDALLLNGEKVNLPEENALKNILDRLKKENVVESKWYNKQKYRVNVDWIYSWSPK